MSDRLLYIAFAASVLGVIGLTYGLAGIKPPLSPIDSVSTNDLGSNIRIQGVVSSVHEFSGGSLMLSLDDGSGVIDVYLPYNTALSLNSTSIGKRRIDVVGTVQVYKGRLEVLVDSADKIVFLT